VVVVSSLKSNTWLKWTAITIISILLFITIIYSIILYNSEYIKNYAFSQFTQNFSVKIGVKNIKINLLSNFPNITIKLEDIYIQNKLYPFNGNRNLLTANEISLTFNIIDIIRKNYKIKTIIVKNSNLNIYFTKNGNNIDIIKSGQTTHNLNIKLNNIVFKKTKLHIVNSIKNQSFIFEIKNLNLAGYFANKNYDLDINTNFKNKKVFLNNDTILSDVPVDGSFKIIVNDNQYNINRTNLYIDDILFKINGFINSYNNYIDLKINSNNFELSNLLNKISNNQIIKNYNVTGIFSFNGYIKGFITNNSYPKIYIYSSLTNGSLNNTEQQISLKINNLVSYFQNYGIKNNFIEFNITKFNVSINENTIDGYASLIIKENDKNIKFKILSNNVNLADLNKFLKNKYEFNITPQNGSAKFQLSFNGNFKNIKKPTLSEINNINLDGQISANNASMVINNINIKNTNANLKITKNIVTIDTIKSNINGNDINISGSLNNILPHIIDKKNLIDLKLNIYSPLLVYDSIQNINNSTDSTYFPILPYYFNLTANIYIDKLYTNKFDLNNLNIKISSKNNVLNVENFKFFAINGAVKGKLIIEEIEKNNFLIKNDIQLNKIEIKDLFYIFNNFTLESITHKNIKGRLTANINSEFKINKYAKIDTNSIIGNVNATIENGELINQKNLVDLSNYLRLKDLREIRFETLKNNIIIKNNKTIIPEMLIKSDKYNINLSGEHYFDGKINYKLNLLLSDILFKKVLKTNKNNPDFPYIEEDSLNKPRLFILITGTVDNPAFKYDTESIRKKITQSLNQDKQNIKAMLKKDFNMFKKDSTLKFEKPKKKGKVYIEWDE